MGDALERWDRLVRHVNGVETVGTPGVRDPDNPCESYDGLGYQGHGRCLSDGHYECTNCSELSPDAPRFHEYGQSPGRQGGRVSTPELVISTDELRALPEYSLTPNWNQCRQALETRNAVHRKGT